MYDIRLPKKLTIHGIDEESKIAKNIKNIIYSGYSLYSLSDSMILCKLVDEEAIGQDDCYIGNDEYIAYNGHVKSTGSEIQVIEVKFFDKAKFEYKLHTIYALSTLLTMQYKKFIDTDIDVLAYQIKNFISTYFVSRLVQITDISDLNEIKKEITLGNSTFCWLIALVKLIDKESSIAQLFSEIIAFSYAQDLRFFDIVKHDSSNLKQLQKDIIELEDIMSDIIDKVTHKITINNNDVTLYKDSIVKCTLDVMSIDIDKGRIYEQLKIKG